MVAGQRWWQVSEAGRIGVLPLENAHPTPTITGQRVIGGASRDRTDDLFHAMEALSQLSYGPNLRKILYSMGKLNPPSD